MSRAFVKEPDGEQVYDSLPERPISPLPNLVTARGLRLIEAEIARLRGELARFQADGNRAGIAEASRDLRYWSARRASAQLVPLPTNTDEARFGMWVTIQRDDGRRQRFQIVGQDEADPAKGLISYASPMAAALLGRKVGDVIKAGAGEAEITAIDAVAED